MMRCKKTALLCLLLTAFWALPSHADTALKQRGQVLH
jgi:hypothetical protein